MHFAAAQFPYTLRRIGVIHLPFQIPIFLTEVVVHGDTIVTMIVYDDFFQTVYYAWHKKNA